MAWACWKAICRTVSTPDTARHHAMTSKGNPYRDPGTSPLRQGANSARHSQPEPPPSRVQPRRTISHLALGMAPKPCSRYSISLFYLVGRTGFEPVTSPVSVPVYTSHSALVGRFLVVAGCRSGQVCDDVAVSAAVMPRPAVRPWGRSGVVGDELDFVAVGVGEIGSIVLFAARVRVLVGE